MSKGARVAEWRSLSFGIVSGNICPSKGQHENAWFKSRPRTLFVKGIKEDQQMGDIDGVIKREVRKAVIKAMVVVFVLLSR